MCTELGSPSSHFLQPWCILCIGVYDILCACMDALCCSSLYYMLLPGTEKLVKVDFTLCRNALSYVLLIML